MKNDVTTRVIRSVRASDHAAVRAIDEAAFGRKHEADLVEALRADDAVVLELVMEVDGIPAGHIAFSRVAIEATWGRLDAVILAPVAVLPQVQRRRLGTALTDAGLALLRDANEQVVLVLGHPDYYPRFGFSADRASAIQAPWSGPAFMAASLAGRATTKPKGKLVCPAPLLAAG